MNATAGRRSAATAVIIAAIAHSTTYAFPATVTGFDSCIRRLSGVVYRGAKNEYQYMGEMS